MLKSRGLGYWLIAASLAALLAIGGFLLTAPSRPDVSDIGDPSKKAGSVISVEHVGGYLGLTLKTLLWWEDIPGNIPINNGLDMYRIRYWTTLNGRPIQTSGLMSVPRLGKMQKSVKGLVVFLHGTMPPSDPAPSAPDISNGVFPSAIYAGGGYILLAPDYIGLGTVNAVHPYLHAEATVAASVDMIRAAQRVSTAMGMRPSPDLYLTGFSQGGHAVAIVQRALEAKPEVAINLRASAAIAGAFDLSDVSIPYSLKHNQSMYLSYLINSYAYYYKQPINTILTDRYASVVPQIYDGKHSWDQIMAALPANPRDMFKPEMLKRIEANDDNWFSSYLRLNSAHQWLPKAPLRLYVGSRDTDVSPEDSRALYRYAKPRGGNISLISVGPYDHGGTAYQSTPLVRAWFDQISATARQN
jgi:hypothetical protein